MIALPRTLASLVAVGTLVSGACVSRAVAQVPDPYVVPRGALRVSFEPSYANYDHLFDAAGSTIGLGTYLSADSLGSFFFPTLTSAELAVRSITGDSAFRFNAGAFRTRPDADIRRFPLSVALGLSSRLTFTATVPLVVTRVNSATVLDTAGANAGWNQVTTAGARDSVVLLLGELTAATAALEAGIAAGQWGCPSEPTCDQARALADRTTALAADLSALTGVPGLVSGDGTTPAPPFAPLAGSSTGQLIQQAFATVSAELVSLGLPALTSSLPLPGNGVPATAVDDVLRDSVFGYDASPLNPGTTTKLSGLGDIEVGLRYGLAQGASLRAVVGAVARLPTGKRDDPANFLDIGTGDHQLDLIWSLDAALEPGSLVGVWLAASYTLQFADRLSRRVTRLDRPIAPASTEAVVDRNLGDVLRVSLHPAIRLASQFRVFVSASYYRKGADSYSEDGTSLADLAALTAMESWGFGAGVWFRGGSGKEGPTMPLDARLFYNAAYFGSGGATPKLSTVNISLRLYYNLWGARPAAPPTPAAPPPQN